MLNRTYGGERSVSKKEGDKHPGLVFTSYSIFIFSNSSGSIGNGKTSNSQKINKNDVDNFVF